MKKMILIMLAVAYSIATINAQTVFSPNTGDVEMDGVLNDVNTKAKNDPVGFSNDVATRFGVPKEKIDAASKVMNPGDVFMSAQVASITKKPFDEVTKSFQANKDKGWGEIAKQMGIKPGSPEFHEMKKSMKANGGGNKGHGNEGKGKEKEVKGNDGKEKEEHGKGNEGKGNQGHGNGNKGKNK